MWISYPTTPCNHHVLFTNAKGLEISCPFAYLLVSLIESLAVDCNPMLKRYDLAETKVTSIFHTAGMEQILIG